MISMFLPFVQFSPVWAALSPTQFSLQSGFWNLFELCN
ncbi:hypothetical protein Pint_18592 [Pistacia integerrima]|uniref:Uncharacterized protein n=1 Tax=Pistacia integerrima TaxID=434235 RepID=A0ACC0YVJ4_9ROSI|nr:hypothetical protein Pint_18592 [Pistacia integerrima]